MINPPVIGDMRDANSLDGTTEDTGVFSGKTQKLSGDTDEEFSSLRFFHAYFSFAISLFNDIF